MTRDQVLDVLGSFLKVMDGLPSVDAIADLIAPAYPDQEIWLPGVGFGDPLSVVEPKIDVVLKGWDYVGRYNTPSVDHYRDGARALRLCLERAQQNERQAA